MTHGYVRRAGKHDHVVDARGEQRQQHPEQDRLLQRGHGDQTGHDERHGHEVDGQHRAEEPGVPERRSDASEGNL